MIFEKGANSLLVLLSLSTPLETEIKRTPFSRKNTEKHRKTVKAKIQDIYDGSRQNYGAPKITVELRKTGEVISERTVGTYMRQMGIRAQWSRPWTITTKDSDFSTELQNILDKQFNPDRPNAVCLGT